MNNMYDDDALEDKTEQVTGSFGKEWEDVILDAEESRGIPEISIGLQENEDTVQIIVENDSEPSNEKIQNDEEDWSEWNPKLLKKERSPLLQIQLRFTSIASSSNTQKVTEQERLDKVVLKRLVHKPYNKRCANKRFEESTALIKSKVEYLEILNKEASGKAEIDKQILKNTLLEQELKIQLLRRQLENPDYAYGRVRNPVFPSNM